MILDMWVTVRCAVCRGLDTLARNGLGVNLHLLVVSSVLVAGDLLGRLGVIRWDLIVER